jgi:hypothetical protein
VDSRLGHHLGASGGGDRTALLSTTALHHASSGAGCSGWLLCGGLLCVALPHDGATCRATNPRERPNRVRRAARTPCTQQPCDIASFQPSMPTWGAAGGAQQPHNLGAPYQHAHVANLGPTCPYATQNILRHAKLAY